MSISGARTIIKGTMQREQNPNYYDEIFKKNLTNARYQGIWEEVLSMLPANANVLEVGCGQGDLGKMIINRGLVYRGFDFSPEAIKQAKVKSDWCFYEDNAYEESSYTANQGYNTVICLEVLEHLDDQKVIRNIPIGKRVIFSVPNFDDPAHLRTYNSIEQIKQRFDGMLEIISHRVYTMPDTGANIYLVDAMRIPGVVRSESKRPTISACMIVKNEQNMIAGCLKSITGLVDEVIICDTGSNDRTADIVYDLSKNGDLAGKIKTFNDPWQDDFSHHRNLSIERATMEWILIIDADERIHLEDIEQLIARLTDTKCKGAALQVYNDMSGKAEQSFHYSIRLFKRSTNWRYEGIVHNALKFDELEPIEETTCRVRHLGYDLNEAQKMEKFKRTRRLLEKQMKLEPQPFVMFNLGNSILEEVRFNAEADMERATELFRNVIMETLPKGPKRHLHLMSWCQKAWCHVVREEPGSAIRCAREALRLKDDYLDALLILGHAFSQARKWEQAITSYKAYIDTRETYDPRNDKFKIGMNNMHSQEEATNGIRLAMDQLRNEVKSQVVVV